MFGEPEADSGAQWGGWLFNSSARSHKDMFDFHPYGCLIPDPEQKSIYRGLMFH